MALVVEPGDEVHLGRARVREADVDPGVDQGADQGVRAVHGSSPRVEIVPGFRDPGRVERRLDPPHQGDLRRVLELRK